MAHVIILDALNEDVFVCGVCKSVFNSLQVFLDHKNACGIAVLEENLNKANILETAVLTSSLSDNTGTVQEGLQLSNVVNNNTETRSAGDDLTCKICKKTYTKSRKLLSHLRIHSEKLYQCSICGRSFAQSSHLQRHILTHKLWPKGLGQTTAKDLHAEVLSYNCTYCNAIFPNYRQYRSHLKIHWNLKKFKCVQGDCMEYYDSIENLLEHVDISHEPAVYSCHLCNCKFNDLDAISIHQNDKHNSEQQATKSKVYKCTKCDAEFRKPEKLSLHLRTDNHRKVCIHCKKIFASNKRLRLHLQIHKSLKVFHCTVCNKSFHMKKYLSTHMLKHGGREYTCSVCNYTFKRSDLLYRHMRLHQPNKILRCPFKESLNCTKEFNRNDKLNAHIKTHTNFFALKTTKAKVSQENSSTNLCVLSLNTETNVLQLHPIGAVSSDPVAEPC